MDPMDPMDPVDPNDRAELDPMDPEGQATSPEPEDGDTPSPETAEAFEPEGFERWRRASALGSVGTGIARGLQNVFAPPPNRPVIVASVPGDPPDPDRLRVILDPDDPSKSVALLPPVHDAGDEDPPA
jgi:hypothetical protein